MADIRRLRRTTCLDCGIELNAKTAFRKGDRGWRSRCKTCHIANRRARETRDEEARRLFIDREVCDICHQPERAKRNGQVRMLCKDHDHRTGEWRGLLCSRCNNAIGLFSDNVGLLQEAIKYLESPPGLVLLDDEPAETRIEYLKYRPK